MCWSGVCEGHDTDVPWTGMCTDGFGNSTCLPLRVTRRTRCPNLDSHVVTRCPDLDGHVF